MHRLACNQHILIYYRAMEPAIDLQRISNALTSKQWEWKIYDGNIPSLLEYLKNSLPHIDHQSWPLRFWLGGVFVNGRLALEDVSLETPCKIEYFEPKFALEDIAAHFPAFDENWIVHKDDDLAVVFKPAGLPCLPNKEQRHYTLKGYLEQHFKRKIHMPSRLDTSTAGLVAISLSQRMHGPLQRGFEHREVQKYYLTKVDSRVQWQSVSIRAAIGRDPRHVILRRIDPQGKPAITQFSKLEQDNQGTVLLARPKTGRTHQIRVHCAYNIASIIGDNFYGGKQHPGLCLLSAGFGFEHPFEKTNIFVTLPQKLAPDWAADSISQITH